MARRLIREILIKLREGDPLTQVTQVVGGVERIRLFRGSALFEDITTAIAGLSEESVRMCFPRYAPQVRRRRERRRRPTDNNLDHFLRIPFFRDVPTESLILALRAIPGVEWAVLAPTLAPQQATMPADLTRHQGYLLEGAGVNGLGPNRGVGATYAWTFAGGNGDDVRIGVVDLRFDEHIDLPAPRTVGSPIPASSVGAVQPLFSTDVSGHGTRVLGILVSSGGTVGTQGISHGATVVFSSTWSDDGLFGALEALVQGDSPVPLRPGDILLIETGVGVKLAGGYVADFPAEANPAVPQFIEDVIEDGIVVIECAGNGGSQLQQAYSNDALATPIWNPADATEAILVGAGQAPSPPASAGSPTACSRHGQSNYGAEVDCQGWGDSVATTTCDGVSADLHNGMASGNPVSSSYTKSFGGTSAAAAIVTGVAACVQGVAREQCGKGWAPAHLLSKLQDDGLGSPQTGNRLEHIGPLPDLTLLLPALRVCPDVYIRDTISDDGTVPSAEIEAASPDIIVRRVQAADPGTSFGTATWSQDDLGEEPLAGSDNFVYVRVKNRGAANDDVVVRVYWTEPSTFLTPDTWHPIGAETLLSAIAPNEVRVTSGVTWPAADVPAGGASLIAFAFSLSQASAYPEDFESDDDFQTYVREHNELAYRSVLTEVAPPAGSSRSARFARRRFHVRLRRRVPFQKPPRGPCGLGIRTNLPWGARVELTSASFTAPHSFKVGVLRKSFRIDDLGLPPDATALVEATVTLPARAHGKYRVVFQQFEGRSLSGSVTMVVSGK